MPFMPTVLLLPDQAPLRPPSLRSSRYSSSSQLWDIPEGNDALLDLWLACIGIHY